MYVANMVNIEGCKQERTPLYLISIANYACGKITST